MSLLAAILPSQFGDATQRSRKGATYRVTDPVAFNRAVWNGLKADKGELLTCIGKNEGGYPEFQRPDAPEGSKPLSMSYKAKGRPDSFGLSCDYRQFNF